MNPIVKAKLRKSLIATYRSIGFRLTEFAIVNDKYGNYIRIALQYPNGHTRSFFSNINETIGFNDIAAVVHTMLTSSATKEQLRSEIEGGVMPDFDTELHHYSGRVVK